MILGIESINDLIQQAQTTRFEVMAEYLWYGFEIYEKGDELKVTSAINESMPIDHELIEAILEDYFDGRSLDAMKGDKFFIHLVNDYEL